MRKNYIVTGASGWLGLNFIEHVLKDKYLRSLTILCERTEKDLFKNLNSEKVNLVFGDITKRETLFPLFRKKEKSYLFHLAGCIHPNVFTKQFFDTNYLGTKNVIQLALAGSVEKAVVISSNSPCGCNPSYQHRFTEESLCIPYMKYGQSKLMMEKYLFNLMNEGNSFPITIIRAPWFYGPKQPKRQKQFFEMIINGVVPIIGSGENQRSMVYVDHLVQGIMLAANRKEANNQLFWIADEKPYSMNFILETIKLILKRNFGILCKRNKVWLPNIVGDISQCTDWTLQKCGLYSQKIHVLSEMNKTIACDISKAKSVLKYKPKVRFEDGIMVSLNEFYNRKV